jgi:beta-galactosidase GanA
MLLMAALAQGASPQGIPSPPLGVLSLAARSSPHLEKQGTATRLIVKGRPMLVLGGELGNSSASSATYMTAHWSRLKQLHLNAVLTPVSWELIEPLEGHFDWSSVDGLLEAARANDLKLVLLWFGTWKNSMSTYVPAWVKRDQTRFPRAQLPSGQGLDILSAFAPSNRYADARAFAALLGHLKGVDGEENTVLMIQVENEVGMLPVAREYGTEAERLFHEGVPEELAANMFYAFGKLDAIGCGPFSIESVDDKQPSPLSEGYSVLSQLSPAILAAQGTGACRDSVPGFSRTALL